MKTVLFYSFKGGVGRTQSMLNVAKYLSEEKGKKVAIVDFDIYAPGLSYILTTKDDIEKDYFLDYLLALFNGNDRKEIFVQNLSENLSLIPAYNMGNIDPYHKRLTELSQFLYSIKSSSQNQADSVSTVADNIFNIIRDDIAKTGDYDYILFDARTGITEVSDILFSQDLDLKVIVSSYNKQNIDGTNKILGILPEAKIKKHKILRVLSPKPIGIDDEDSKYISIKLEANLESNEYKYLKDQFDWNRIFEIHYEKEVVINDFDVWNNIDEKKQYKQDITAIGNKIEDILKGNQIL